MTKEMRELLQEIKDLKESKETIRAKAKDLLVSNKVEEAKVYKNKLEQVASEIDKLQNKYNEKLEEYELAKQKIEDKINSTSCEANKMIAIKNAIYPNEKIYNSNKQYENKDINLGKLVRGLSGKGWEGAKTEQTYLNMTASGNKVLIPSVLSEQILDYARNQSALLGQIPTIIMDNNNLTIAVQKTDPTAHFVGEGEAITESEPTFESVQLEGKDLAIYVPITDKLLDSSNIAEQLMQSTAKALATALDYALIYGTGANSIKGLNEVVGVQKVEHQYSNMNYDFVVAGAKAIRKANLKPTNVCFNSDLASELELAKTADGQYMEVPKFMDKYTVTESNNVKENQAIVYDVNSLLLAINKNISIEWGYINDDFKKLQRGLRVHIRADFVAVKPTGVSIVTVTKK